MYRFIVSVFIVSVLLLGCSEKANKYAKPTDILHEQSLTQTQKSVLKEKSKIKIYFIITQINRINHPLIKEDDEYDRFIVSAYIPNEKDAKSYDNLLFRVNGKKPISIKEIKKDNKLLTVLPGANPWSRYFIVKGETDKSKNGVSFEAGTKSIGTNKMEFHDRYGNLSTPRAMGFKSK